MKYTLCPPFPSFPLPLSQTNPPLSVQAAVAATTPAKEPSQGALETFCRALFSSSSSNSLCIYMLYRIGIGTGIGIALRLSSALCYVALGRGEGDSRSLLLLASFLDSTLVLARGSWLALRHFGLVCVRKCTWLDIFSGGCLWVAACLPATALWFPWCTCQCGKCRFVALTLCTGNYAARTLATTQRSTNERCWLVACPKHFDTQLNCEFWLFSSHFPPLLPPVLPLHFPLRRAHAKRFDKRECACVCVCRCPAAHKYINACARLDCSHNMRIYNYGSWVSSFLPSSIRAALRQFAQGLVIWGG